MNNEQPSVLSRIIVFAVTLLIIAVALEFYLVNSNKDGKNYDIEMWKYSRELKFISENAKLGHEHTPSKQAILQNTEIVINSLGMRDTDTKELDIKALGEDTSLNKLLMLGSSITLGWGVELDKTYPYLLDQALANHTVYNSGIGNYNTSREVELLKSRLAELKPQNIVLSYFINDAEILPTPRQNWFLQNSQLAVTLWSRLQQILTAFGVQQSLEEHYQSIYEEDYEGYQAVKTAFADLQAYAAEHGSKVTVALIPDIHNLSDYPFGFVHEQVSQLAADHGFAVIDFYSSFAHIEDAQTIWAMPGDPHPNAKGHKIMADQLIRELQL